MNQQRYFAYRSLLSELGEWRSMEALEDDAYDELCDAAEGLLLSRAGEEAEEPLARATEVQVIVVVWGPFAPQDNTGAAGVTVPIVVPLLVLPFDGFCGNSFESKSVCNIEFVIGSSMIG